MADVPQRQVDEKFYAYPSSKIVGIIETPDNLQGSQGRWDRSGRHRGRLKITLIWKQESSNPLSAWS